METSVEHKVASAYVVAQDKQAATLGSVHDAVFQWTHQLAQLILKYIPSNYKLDEAKVIPDTGRRGQHIRCHGTSARDLDVQLGIYIAVFPEGIRGVLDIEEVGMGKSKYELDFGLDARAAVIVARVADICEKSNRQ